MYKRTYVNRYTIPTRTRALSRISTVLPIGDRMHCAPGRPSFCTALWPSVLVQDSRPIHYPGEATAPPPPDVYYTDECVIICYRAESGRPDGI